MLSRNDKKRLAVLFIFLAPLFVINFLYPSWWSSMQQIDTDKITAVEHVAARAKIDLDLTSECPAGQSRVAVRWTAPESVVSDIKLSGTTNAIANGFVPYTYTNDMITGSPDGMKVTKTANSVMASYSLCTPTGTGWQWSVSYRDSQGLRRWSCEGTVTENGTWDVVIDGKLKQTPYPVSNGLAGCNHEFVQ